MERDGEEGRGGRGSRGKLRWGRERGVKTCIIGEQRRRKVINHFFPLLFLSASLYLSYRNAVIIFPRLCLDFVLSVPSLSLSLSSLAPCLSYLISASCLFFFYFLPLSNLSLSFIPPRLWHSVSQMKASLCAGSVCFFQTWCFRQSSGVPEHVLTTPTHRTSHSTFKQRKHTHIHTLTLDSCFAPVEVFFLSLDIQITFSNTFFCSVSCVLSSSAPP